MYYNAQLQTILDWGKSRWGGLVACQSSLAKHTEQPLAGSLCLHMFQLLPGMGRPGALPEPCTPNSAEQVFAHVQSGLLRPGGPPQNWTPCHEWCSVAFAQVNKAS
jgi:hypothetical protein